MATGKGARGDRRKTGRGGMLRREQTVGQGVGKEKGLRHEPGGKKGVEERGRGGYRGGTLVGEGKT